MNIVILSISKNSNNSIYFNLKSLNELIRVEDFSNFEKSITSFKEIYHNKEAFTFNI